MIELFGLLFTIGGILGFIVMVFHNWYITDNNNDVLFIFGGGFILAYFLEFTLVNFLDAYDYTNLPLAIFDIPVVIPLGWVVTFYGLSTLSRDYLELLDKPTKSVYIIVLSGLMAVFFGMAIEVLARNIEFWVFHFDSVTIVGVPIIVTLAWGLSVATFATGLELYHHRRNYWWLILLGTHMMNSLIAVILIQFVEFV